MHTHACTRTHTHTHAHLFRFQKAYVRSVDDVLRNLLDYSLPSHMAFLGTKYNRDSATPSPNMDHLTCFYPGMLALGILYDLTPDKRGVAKNLTHTCYYMYNSTTPTGLAPEVFYFNRNPAKRVDILPSPVSQVTEDSITMAFGIG